MIPTSWHTRRHIHSLQQINKALKPKIGSPLEAMLKDALAGELGHTNKDMQEDLLLLHDAQQKLEAAIVALEHYLERCQWKDAITHSFVGANFGTAIFYKSL